MIQLTPTALAGIVVVVSLLLLVIVGCFAWIHISKRLGHLKDDINDISSRQSADDICRLALNTFLQNYKFDYAVISLIDYTRRFVDSTYYDSNNISLGEADPKNWVKHSNYPLTKDDILVKIIKGEHNVKVVGRRVYDSTKQITFDDLNPTIYKTYEHHRLARVFLPIIYREKKFHSNQLKADKTDDRIVLGVIEVGFVNSWQNYVQKLGKLHSVSRIIPFWFGDTFRWFLRQDTATLQLYIDNFAQSYFKAILIDKRGSSLLDDEKSSNNQQYRELVLKKTAKLIGAEYAVLSFRTADNEMLDFANPTNLYYNLAITDFRAPVDNAKSDVRQYVADPRWARSYFTGNMANDFYHIADLEKTVQSALIVPLKIRNDVVGLLAFFATQENWFKIIHRYWTEDIAERLLDIYSERKALMAYNALLPSGIWNEPGEIYEQVIKALTPYYDTRAIGVWERVQNSFTLQKELSTEEVRHSFPDGYQTEPQTNPAFFKSFMNENVLLVKSGDQSNTGNWWHFNLKLSDPYKALIIVGILVQQQIEAVLTIYLRHIPARFDSEFPRQVAQKIALALMNTRLSKAVNNLTRINSEQPSGRLQQVVNVARTVTNADSVSLFQYSPGSTIKTGDGIVDGYSILESDRTREACFANLVVGGAEPGYWLSTPTDYFRQLEIMMSRPVDETERQQSVWNKMKLASVAAFRLSAESVVLGVMFFNFKTPMNFNQGSDTRRFIELFVGLANVQLQNLNLVANIEGELVELTTSKKAADLAINGLEQERTQLEKARASIQFDYEETYRKMERMVPMSQQVLFLNILRGVNHDVRHFLYDLHMTIAADSSGKLTDKAEEVNSIARNIESILSLFNFTTFKTEFVDVNSIITDVVKLFKFRVRERVRFYTDELDKQLPDLKSNKAELSMMIYNLVGNAVSAIYKVNKQHIGEIRITTRLTNKQYVITVSDNGCGIPNELLDKVFEPGFTTKPSGLGIGLFFVRELVENKYSGTVALKSVVNKGAAFTIFIPEYINY